jgi:hypothetical protein
VDQNFLSEISRRADHMNLFSTGIDVDHPIAEEGLSSSVNIHLPSSTGGFGVPGFGSF